MAGETKWSVVTSHQLLFAALDRTVPSSRFLTATGLHILFFIFDNSVLPITASFPYILV